MDQLNQTLIDDNPTKSILAFKCYIHTVKNSYRNDLDANKICELVEKYVHLAGKMWMPSELLLKCCGVADDCKSNMLALIMHCQLRYAIDYKTPNTRYVITPEAFLKCLNAMGCDNEYVHIPWLWKYYTRYVVKATPPTVELRSLAILYNKNENHYKLIQGAKLYVIKKIRQSRLDLILRKDNIPGTLNVVANIQRKIGLAMQINGNTNEFRIRGMGHEDIKRLVEHCSKGDS